MKHFILGVLDFWNLGLSDIAHSTSQFGLAAVQLLAVCGLQ